MAFGFFRCRYCCQQHGPRSPFALDDCRQCHTWFRGDTAECWCGRVLGKDQYHHEALTRPDMFAGWPMLACVILVFEAINSRRSLAWRAPLGAWPVAAGGHGTQRHANRHAGAAAGCLAACLCFVQYPSQHHGGVGSGPNRRCNCLLRSLRLQSLEARFSDRSMETGSARLLIWSSALSVIFPANPILGVGWNNFAHAMEHYGLGYTGRIASLSRYWWNLALSDLPYLPGGACRFSGSQGAAIMARC